MTIDLQATFDKFEDEYLNFDSIEEKRSQRPDLHAFLLLDALIPGTSDIVSASEHDEFYLNISPDELAEVATESDILALVRCGVRFSGERDSLSMYA